MNMEERLENVERDLRHAKFRIHWLLAMIGLCLGVVIVVGAFEILARGLTFKEVCAKRFVLKEKNGKTGAELSVTKYGPMLFLYDEKGKFRAVLGVNKDGDPGLRFLDENGKTRAGISVRKDGPVLVFFDEESNKSRVILKVDDQGPTLELGDEKGFIRAGIAAPKAGPRLFLHDENGNQRARISVNALGTELALWDEHGKQLPIR
jgi:hypothetical protein